MQFKIDIESIKYIGSSFKEKTLRVQFSANYGDIVAIIGESGTGKTSLLNIIAKYFNKSYKKRWYSSLNPFQKLSLGYYKGEIYFHKDESDIFFSYKISYLPQELFLFPDASIKDNLSITNESERKILDLLNTFDLHKNLNEKVTTLSGGERQRIGIARAFLMNDFDILLLDEPLNGIDSVNKRIIIDYIYDFVKRERKICFIVTHDIHDVLPIANRFIIFADEFKVNIFNNLEELMLTNNLEINKLLFGHNLIEYTYQNNNYYIKPSGIYFIVDKINKSVINAKLIDINLIYREIKIEIDEQEIKMFLHTFHNAKNTDDIHIIKNKMWLIVNELTDELLTSKNVLISINPNSIYDGFKNN